MLIKNWEIVIEWISAYQQYVQVSLGTKHVRDKPDIDNSCLGMRQDNRKSAAMVQELKAQSNN